MIKKLLLVLSMMAIGLSCSAEDSAGKAYAEGTHYDVISPAVRTLDPDKIEVAEYFAHSCGHCYAFEPLVQQWKESKPDDVSFRGVPVVFRATGEVYARAYYAAAALGVQDKISTVMFQTIHVDRKPLASEDQMEALFVANGVSAEDFTKAFNSFGVSSQVNQAVSLAKSAKIQSTPTMVVNGKYRVNAGMGGHAQMLEVVNFLVEKERAAKGS